MTPRALQRIDEERRHGYRYKIRRRYVDEKHMKEAFVRIINRKTWHWWLRELMSIPLHRDIYFQPTYTYIAKLDDGRQYKYGWDIKRIDENEKGILYQIYVYDYVEESE